MTTHQELASRIRFALRPLVRLTLAASICSCAGVQEVVESKQTGDGVSAVYSVAPEKAQQIGVAVFRWEGAERVEEHPKDGYMLAEVGMSAFSWGTVTIASRRPSGSSAPVESYRRPRRTKGEFNPGRRGVVHLSFSDDAAWSGRSLDEMSR